MTTTFTFENINNDDSIELYPEQFEAAIMSGLQSSELEHTDLVALLDAGFLASAAVIILEAGYKLDNVPEFITPSTDLEEIELYNKTGIKNIQDLVYEGMTADQAVVLIENDVYTIPEFLSNETTDTIIEWCEAIDESHSKDEDQFAAAFTLGIDASSVEDAYMGKFDDDEAFAIEQADSIGAIDWRTMEWPSNCIDWEQAATELMQDHIEDNGYYFSANW